MYEDLMLDIETLAHYSKKRDHVILSIGAVAFNLDDEDSYDVLEATPEREFYRILNVPQQMKAGLRMDYDTVHWWMNQNAQAKHELFGENTPYEDVLKVLNDLNRFIANNECRHIWANGNDFDVNNLHNLYEAFNMKLPFKFPDGRPRYGNEQNLRTLKLLTRRLGASTNHRIVKGIEHHALHDARFQVLVAQYYFRAIGGEG